MLDALLGAIFEMVFSLVVTAFVKLFSLENAADIAAAVIGLGLIAIGFAAAVWGH